MTYGIVPAQDCTPHLNGDRANDTQDKTIWRFGTNL
jgi:hypothetical protein